MVVGEPGWSGTVVLGDGLLVYLGPGAHAGRHAHDAIQLVMTAGRPFIVELEAPHSATWALVSSRTTHAIRATADPLALVLVEPRGRRGRALRGIADRLGGDSRMLPPRPEATATQLLDWADDALATLIGEDASSRDAQLAPIIREVLTLVEGTLPGIVRLTEAAEEVAMSPSALTHLFTREVGMPFRRYVLWARLRRAAVLVQEGADLTTAAATAGFADGAHLSRSFRSLFGLPPSEVLSTVTIISRFDRIVQANETPTIVY